MKLVPVIVEVEFTYEAFQRVVVEYEVVPDGYSGYESARLELGAGSYELPDVPLRALPAGRGDA